VRFTGKKKAWQNFDHPDELLTAFLTEIKASNLPVYLSIDKDVLSSEVVMTNWDQGKFLEKHLQSLIEACKGRLVAADITGDVSAYHYKNYFKRFSSFGWATRTDCRRTLKLAIRTESSEPTVNSCHRFSLVRSIRKIPQAVGFLLITSLRLRQR